MRAFSLGLLILVIAAAPSQAQQLATVRVEARVQIPDFLSVKQGETKDVVREDGTRIRRITLYVTANRSWNLSVVRSGSVVDVATGNSGNAQAVTVELAWKDDAPPDPNALNYFLTAD
jgi:hypothetical protein